MPIACISAWSDTTTINIPSMTAYSNTIYYNNNNTKYYYNYDNYYYYYNNDYNKHARLIGSHWNLVSPTGIGGGVSVAIVIPLVPVKSDAIYYNNHNNYYECPPNPTAPPINIALAIRLTYEHTY